MADRRNSEYLTLVGSILLTILFIKEIFRNNGFYFKNTFNDDVISSTTDFSDATNLVPFNLLILALFSLSIAIIIFIDPQYFQHAYILMILLQTIIIIKNIVVFWIPFSSTKILYGFERKTYQIADKEPDFWTYLTSLAILLILIGNLWYILNQRESKHPDLVSYWLEQQEEIKQ